MILVTTTGKVGSEASRLLAKRGVPVRVLAHHPSAAALAEAGVDIVEGDLDGDLRLARHVTDGNPLIAALGEQAGGGVGDDLPGAGLLALAQSEGDHAGESSKSWTSLYSCGAHYCQAPTAIGLFEPPGSVPDLFARPRPVRHRPAGNRRHGEAAC